MSAKGTIPCSQCGSPVPLEHSRCSRCGTTMKYGALADLPTTPGAPLVRAPKRRRISSHDLVPYSLRQEYEQLYKERAQQGSYAAAVRRMKFFYAAGIGAALTAIPVAVPTFLFMPRKSDAVLLLGLDFLLGAFSGSFTLRLGGGLFQGLVLFAIGFAISLSLRLKLGYPIEHHPVAFAVLASATALSVLVSCVIGVALDEHAGQA